MNPTIRRPESVEAYLNRLLHRDIIQQWSYVASGTLHTYAIHTRRKDPFVVSAYSRKVAAIRIFYIALELDKDKGASTR